jgi:hypothetical protein
MRQEGGDAEKIIHCWSLFQIGKTRRFVEIFRSEVGAELQWQGHNSFLKDGLFGFNDGSQIQEDPIFSDSGDDWRL